MRFNLWRDFFRVLWPSLPERPSRLTVWGGSFLLIGVAGMAPRVTAVLCAVALIRWRFIISAKRRQDAESEKQRQQVDQLVGDACAYIEGVNASRSFPTVWAKNVNLKAGEFALLHESATLFEHKTKRYMLGAGTRLRAGKIPIYFGGAHRFEYDALEPVTAGDLYATNQRVIFVSQKKTVMAPLATLVGIDAIPGAIVLHSPKRQQPHLFGVENSALWTMLLKLFTQGHLATQTLPEGVTIAAQTTSTAGEVDVSITSHDRSVRGR